MTSRQQTIRLSTPVEAFRAARRLRRHERRPGLGRLLHADGVGQRDARGLHGVVAVVLIQVRVVLVVFGAE